MEHLDDKNIRNKIDSLDSLPAGYEPSVQSKWELLENALPEKKTSNRKFILAIAASIILLIGITGILVKNIFEPISEMVLENKVNENRNIAKTEVQKAGGLDIAKSEISNFTLAKNPNNIIRHVAKNSVKNNSEISIPIIKDSVAENVIPEEILPENRIAATSAKPKKSKKMFVEIDFNDAPQIQDKQLENLAENKVKFKVSIFKNKEKIAESAPQNTVLKLSKEFPINN